MGVSVLGVAYGTGTTAPLGAGTAIAGDIVVAMTVTANGSPTVPSSVSGCGATWALLHASTRTSVWIGTSPTTIGTVTQTGGTTGGIAAWWLRDAAATGTVSWADSLVGDVVVSGEATTVGTTQAILALAQPSDALPGTGALPSAGAWTVANSTSLRRAHAAPTTPAVYQATSVRAGSRTILVQAVIGTPPPTPPTGLVLTPTATTIEVDWIAPTGTPATGYTVKLGTDGPVDVGNVLTHTFTGLPMGTEYDIEVRAYNLGGTSSLVSGTTTTLSPPSPPESLSVSDLGIFSAEVSWLPPSSGPSVIGYEVRVNAGTPANVGLSDSYVAMGLSAETSYTVEVRAISEEELFSEWASIGLTTLGAGRTLEWDALDDRYYMTGLDRGVLYPKVGNPVPWNGLKSIDEAGNGTKTILYRDGRIFYADVEPGDFEGSLTAFFYPDEFAVCAGIPQVTEGLFVDNQRPQRFGLSYRSLIGSGNSGDIFGYQIHLVYKAVASIGTRSRKTMTNTPELMDFAFDICATPVKLPGMRPSAHYIIDTRFLDSTTLLQLEVILYGDGISEGRLPEPQELFDLMHFGSAITFTDNLDGTWTASGSSANLIDNGDGTWQILNVNGTDHGDGTFTLEDTP